MLGIEVHQQKYLSEGDLAMHAILTVTTDGEPAPVASGAAQVLLVDCSSSMLGKKIEAAKRAAAAAVGVLPDGVLFAVVRGTQHAAMVYPPQGNSLVVASDETRRAAQHEIAGLTAYGGTAMSSWLDRAKWLFAEHADIVRHAILLTDGRNESESAEMLRATLDACEGHFSCDARGIGDGWDPAELEEIVRTLRGSADSVVEPGLLAEDFRRLVEQALTKVLPEIRLHVGTMGYSRLRFLKQVRPDKYDLTDRCRPGEDGEVVLSLGSWASGESRDYHLRVDLDSSAELGYDRERLLAWARPESAGGSAEPVTVVGQWTRDPVAATVIDPMVQLYTAEGELGEALAEGGAAWGQRPADAERAWGIAVRLATEQGKEEILDRLRRVVEILDAGTGRVRLRGDASRSAVLSVIISTVSRMRQPGEAGQDPDPVDLRPVICPHCKETVPGGAFCEDCGEPLGEATA